MISYYMVNVQASFISKLARHGPSLVRHTINLSYYLVKILDFRFYLIFVYNTRIDPEDITVLSRDLSFYNTTIRYIATSVITIFIFWYFAFWNTFVNFLPYIFPKTFITFPFCRNSCCQNPNHSLNTTQYNHNWCWVWYEYDCSPPHPPTHPTQELYLSYIQQTRQCKLTQSLTILLDYLRQLS